MCKNYFENMYRILVLIRSNIRDKKNIEVLEVLITSVEKEWKNTEVIGVISEIMPDLKRQLLLQNDKCYKLTDEAKEYLLRTLHIAQKGLIESRYDVAYDVVDMLHVFPHVIIANDRQQTEDYWKIYVTPVIRARNISENELTKFTECRA